MNSPAKGMQRGRVDAPGFALVAVALLAEVLLLWSASRFGDFFVPGNASRYVPLVLVSGLFYFVALGGFEKVPPVRRGFVLWGVALLLRGIVLLMPPCDDLWRYLWEGKIQAHHFNPYLFNPDHAALASLRENWWGNINHRDYAAIYPPGIELIFRGLTHFSLSPFFFKTCFALADFGTISLLLKMNTGSGRYRTTAWYAWNPAVVLAFAGAGHYDSLFLLAFVAAILALHRANPLGNCTPVRSWAIISATLLGIAISLKTIPIFLVPLWAFALGKRCYAVALSLAIPLALALPFGGMEVATRSLAAFTKVARFNDLVWWLIDRTVWPNPAHQNTRYTLILLVAVAVLTWKFRNDWRRGALWIMGAALILTPVLHPWYATWILPLACWRRAWAWFVFALTLQLAYTQWDNTFFGPAWSDSSVLLKALIAVPPLLVLAWQKYSERKTALSTE